MGVKSFIVCGFGNLESFCLCSYGVGWMMSCIEVKCCFIVDDQVKVMQGVECWKDVGVVDEILMVYKDIDVVMVVQCSFVEVVYMLCQVVCVKGQCGVWLRVSGCV